MHWVEHTTLHLNGHAVWHSPLHGSTTSFMCRIFRSPFPHFQLSARRLQLSLLQDRSCIPHPTVSDESCTKVKTTASYYKSALL